MKRQKIIKECKECKKEFTAYDEFDDTCCNCHKDKCCQICLDCEEWFLGDNFQILCDKCSEKNKIKKQAIANKHF